MLFLVLHILLYFEYISHDYVHDNAQLAQMVNPAAMALKVEGSNPKVDNSLFSNMD